MNRDDVTRWAREAGLLTIDTADGGEAVYTWPKGITEELERFAQAAYAAGAAHVRETEFKPDWNNYQQGLADGAAVEREACEALYAHEDVQAPVGNSAWGEAYQDGWIAGAQAYRDAIRARGQA